MAQSAKTYLQSAALKTAGETRVPEADFDNGMNRAGSCAPGVGIATGNGECKLSDWTLLDQFAQARDPQQSQHVGQSASDINVEAGADLNDTVSLTVIADGWEVNAVA